MKNYFFILLLISQVAYAQKYKIEELPDWVKKVEIPKKNTYAKYDISSGYYLTLVDYQVNLDEDAIFTHEVVNVVSYTGITKASQLVITYDTSYQRIKIHHLYIWRKGKKIDRTSELSFEKINNEYSLNNGIYMGRITEYDNLSDIRKDDLIDFAYTLVGKNPIFENGKYLFMPLATINPIDQYYLSVLYSKDKDYEFKCVDCDSSINFSDGLTDRYRQIEINTTNVKPIKLEDNMPSWVIPFKYFTLSSFKTWTEVNKWAQSVFALKTEPDLIEVFKEIFNGNETTEEKINKIIDYVQDDIRYMGIESGIGSIKPFSPNQVVKQRFGDCKDKSLLLVSLLKKIGIEEAYPALVNGRMQDKIDNLLPSSEIFNHCIVVFNYKNKTYWIDPTFTLQGGDFRNLSIVDYGKALIVGLTSDSLSKVCAQNFKSEINLTEELTINSFTEPASLEIKSDRYGFEADQRRLLLDRYTSIDISKSVSDDLKLMYPIVNKTEDMVINDDNINNSVLTTYKYSVDGFWQDGDNKPDSKLAGYWLFKFEPQALYQYLNVSSCVKRDFDFALSFPLNLNYQVILHFPKEILVYDNYIKYDNEAFFYDEKIEQLSAKSLQITYHFKTKASFIKAAYFEKICDERNKIAKNLPIVIYFNK